MILDFVKPLGELPVVERITYLTGTMEWVSGMVTGFLMGVGWLGILFMLCYKNDLPNWKNFLIHLKYIGLYLLASLLAFIIFIQLVIWSIRIDLRLMDGYAG